MGNEYIGYQGTGSFTQSGGRNSPSGYLFLGYFPGGSGTYGLSGDGVLNGDVIVGWSGTGSFTQSGGSSNATQFDLGFNAGGNGTYNLSGGTLFSSQYQSIGDSGTGSFTQSGGYNSIGFSSGSSPRGLQLGYKGLANGPAGSGTYYLTGGSLLVASVELIGIYGSGSFTQSGGTNSSPSMVLGQLAMSAGTYNLNGGLLRLSSLTRGSGTAKFNFGGGTFQAASSFSTGVPITLTTSGSNAVFDTNGNTLTLAGVLSGPGGLQKIGSGTLVLSASNAYSGDTIVNDGTLTIDYPYLAAVSNAWIDNSGLGGILDLNYDGTDGVNSLYINGVEQAAGIWGGPGSGAPNTSSYLAGSGLLAVAVPEPSTLALLAAGAIGLLGYAWRRRATRTTKP